MRRAISSSTGAHRICEQVGYCSRTRPSPGTRAHRTVSSWPYKMAEAQQECSVMFGRPSFCGLESKGTVKIDVVRLGNRSKRCSVNVSTDRDANVKVDCAQANAKFGAATKRLSAAFLQSCASAPLIGLLLSAATQNQFKDTKSCLSLASGCNRFTSIW
eukprot:SAG31_NODE_678_length_12892_cov_5.458063_7_plen_159_part_00